MVSIGGNTVSTLELSKAIGQPATINQGGLTVRVRISDVKQAYGCTRYLVTPLAGEGSVWVDSNRVTIQNESEVQS